MPRNRTTLRDIAAKAGVTATTVSLALRGDRRISAATRKRIHTLAGELDYRPNPLVSALMSQVQTGRRIESGCKLVFLAPKETQAHANANPFTYARDLITAMRTRAEQLGYAGIDFLEPDTANAPLQQAARVMLARGIRGAILPPFYGKYVFQPIKLETEGFALVSVGYSQPIRNVHRVAHDQYAVAYGITKHLLTRGYQRVGLTLSDNFDARTGRHYTGGFLGAIRENPGAWLSRKVVFTREGRNDADVYEWIMENRLDSIITQYPTDLEQLRGRGIRIPEDFGLASLSTGSAASPTSGMFHDPVELGYAAVDLLTAHMNRNETGIPKYPKTVLTRPKWIEGETLRPPP